MLNSDRLKSAESFYLDRPLNFAHRGASRQAPANTLAPFLLAAELGAEGIELDAQLSKDGEVVVIHDFTLEATTNGKGPVRSMTLAELRELDAGSRFDPTFAGQRIPTLQEVADTVGRRLLLNVELKMTGMRDEGLAEEALRIIEDNHLIARTVVSSFNPFALRGVRQLNPHIFAGLLYAPDQPIWLRSRVQPKALPPHHSLVTSDYVQ
jgi:glycerophosphoryl diester phosphodiesterase